MRLAVSECSGEMLWIFIIPWKFCGLLRTFDADYGGICDIGVGQKQALELCRRNLG